MKQPGKPRAIDFYDAEDEKLIIKSLLWPFYPLTFKHCTVIFKNIVIRLSGHLNATMNVAKW